MKKFIKWLEVRETVETMSPTNDHGHTQIMLKLDAIIEKLNYIETWLKESEESEEAYLQDIIKPKKKLAWLNKSTIKINTHYAF